MPLWFAILLVVAACCLFCWYLSPTRLPTPSKIQKILAKTWILFRRLICFTGAGFGLLVIYIMLVSDESLGYRILSSLAVLVLSVFFVYVGVVGQGWNQYSLNDDFSLYKKIKEKYGIRW